MAIADDIVVEHRRIADAKSDLDPDARAGVGPWTVANLAAPLHSDSENVVQPVIGARAGLAREDGDVSQQARWWAVTVDCKDPRQVVDFWSAVLDCAVIEPGADRSGWFRLEPLGSSGPYMNFQPVAEPKIGKVRIHVDVLVDDLDAAVDRVVARGGSDTGAREELPRGRIAVMQDPEGNEFCLLAPPVS